MKPYVRIRIYGRGSILTRTQKLKEMGLKTSKDLRKMIPEAFSTPTDEDEEEESN